MTESTLQTESEFDDSKSTSATDHLPQAESQAVDKAVDKTVGLSGMIRRLLQDCPTKQATYDTLMQVCEQRLPASLVRSDYQVGSVMLSEIRHDERMSNVEAKKFSDLFMAQVAKEVRASSSREPQLKRFERAGQQLTIAAAPIVDVNTNEVDGVLTVMLGGASHQAEFILPILDGITATASATLLSRSLAASQPQAGSGFGAQTTDGFQGKLPNALSPSSQPFRPTTLKATQQTPEQAAAKPEAKPEAKSEVATPISMVGGTAMAAAALKPVSDALRKSSAAAKANTATATKTQTTNKRVETPSTGAAVPAGSVPAAAMSATAARLAEADATAHAEVSALSKAARFSSLKEFGFTLVNAISNQFQCEQVAFAAEQNLKIKIHAISGIADFKNSSPGVASIRQAMEECLDEKNPVAVPGLVLTGDFAAVPSRAIHQQWSVECNNSAVCSLPLFDNDDVVAVVSLRRAADRPFTQTDIAKLKSMLQAYGPAVRVVEKAGQPVGSRISSAVKTKASDSMTKGSWGRRILLLGFLAAAVWFCFGTMTYQPLCQSTITAANLRHFSAPFDGQLQAVAVSPGQRVAKGEILVQFDTSNLKLEMIGLQRQISASNVQVKQAVSEGELGQASMANARLGVLQTQISAVQKQIDEATITAPTDGVVVLSDLQQRIGQEFPQGEEILQFVADGDWLLQIEVPDSLVSVVEADQTGEFAPASDPTNKHKFRIDNVDGAASVLKNRNVFLAHADFEVQPEQMMTGMEGTSKLTTVDRPVWWVALHGAIDWARINFWL
ncbi:MAG: biotin/lipoyl-binding protein [Fuerstiella sp.]